MWPDGKPLHTGLPAKVISERLGHATAGFTLQTDTHVIPGMDESTADLVDHGVADRGTDRLLRHAASGGGTSYLLGHTSRRSGNRVPCVKKRRINQHESGTHMSSRHNATPTASDEHRGSPASGLSISAWSRPQPVSLTVGNQQVIGHALAERGGRDGRQILVSLNGGHLSWVAAQRVRPCPPPQTQPTDPHHAPNRD